MKVTLESCQELAALSQFSQVKAHYVSCLPEISEQEIVAIAQTEQRYWLSWSSSIGAWIEAGGKDVTILIDDDEQLVDLDELTLGFASALTGTCLNLQGQVAIHANAVCNDEGQAIAFVGPSGAGKSTLSTYCVQRGMNLLTDDVLVVDECDYVLPGNPRIKLFPHTGTALQLESPQETTDYKLFYDARTLGATILEAPVQLRAIYLLNGTIDRDIGEENADTQSQPKAHLTPSTQAIFDLLNNSYAAREFSNVWPRLLDRYQHLVKQIPVFTLTYPHDFSQLPAVYELLNAS